MDKLNESILKKKIIPLVGNKLTWLSDLDRVGYKLFPERFRGVFTSDKVPKGLRDGYMIINLDRSDQGGSHWIGAAILDGKTYVYDSFGRTHTKIIPSLKDDLPNIRDTEPDAEQQLDETNCGARSLAFLEIFHRFGPEVAMLL